jgi:hypothetical protein
MKYYAKDSKAFSSPYLVLFEGKVCWGKKDSPGCAPLTFLSEQEAVTKGKFYMPEGLKDRVVAELVTD